MSHEHEEHNVVDLSTEPVTKTQILGLIVYTAYKFSTATTDILRYADAIMDQRVLQQVRTRQIAAEMRDDIERITGGENG